MPKQPKHRRGKSPIVVPEMDEAVYLRRMLGLHPGLVYIRNPHMGDARQWVVTHRDACESAAKLVWRHVTVICAGPDGILVAGRSRGRDAIVEVWRDRTKLHAVEYESVEGLALAIRDVYDAIGADK